MPPCELRSTSAVPCATHGPSLFCPLCRQIGTPEVCHRSSCGKNSQFALNVARTQKPIFRRDRGEVGSIGPVWLRDHGYLRRIHTVVSTPPFCNWLLAPPPAAYGRPKPPLRLRSADSNRASAAGIWSVRLAPAMVSPIGGDRRLELKHHSSSHERDFLH